MTFEVEKDAVVPPDSENEIYIKVLDSVMKMWQNASEVKKQDLSISDVSTCCSPTFTSGVEYEKELDLEREIKIMDALFRSNEVDDMLLAQVYASRNNRKRKAEFVQITGTTGRRTPKPVRTSSPKIVEAKGPKKKAGRPVVERTGCRCLLCEVEQTSQWRFLDIFTDGWMDLVCNACYMKQTNRKANVQLEFQNKNIPERPTLESFELHGAIAYPHLMPCTKKRLTKAVNQPRIRNKDSHKHLSDLYVTENVQKQIIPSHQTSEPTDYTSWESEWNFLFTNIPSIHS
eukprot:GHVP01071076.1.p1 GENE.GHVP01071076.1~~GHVP01071076.1.p1  ORF type:complete len:288 (+),score=45.61 GHVP01071076.1:333-1196(+)